MAAVAHNEPAGPPQPRGLIRRTVSTGVAAHVKPNPARLRLSKSQGNRLCLTPPTDDLASPTSPQLSQGSASAFPRPVPTPPAPPRQPRIPRWKRAARPKSLEKKPAPTDTATPARLWHELPPDAHVYADDVQEIAKLLAAAGHGDVALHDVKYAVDKVVAGGGHGLAKGDANPKLTSPAFNAVIDALRRATRDSALAEHAMSNTFDKFASDGVIAVDTIREMSSAFGMSDDMSPNTDLDLDGFRDFFREGPCSAEERFQRYGAVWREELEDTEMTIRISDIRSANTRAEDTEVFDLASLLLGDLVDYAQFKLIIHTPLLALEEDPTARAWFSSQTTTARSLWRVIHNAHTARLKLIYSAFASGESTHATRLAVAKYALFKVTHVQGEEPSTPVEYSTADFASVGAVNFSKSLDSHPFVSSVACATGNKLHRCIAGRYSEAHARKMLEVQRQALWLALRALAAGLDPAQLPTLQGDDGAEDALMWVCERDIGMALVALAPMTRRREMNATLKLPSKLTFHDLRPRGREIRPLSVQSEGNSTSGADSIDGDALDCSVLGACVQAGGLGLADMVPSWHNEMCLPGPATANSETVASDTEDATARDNSTNGDVDTDDSNGRMAMSMSRSRRRLRFMAGVRPLPEDEQLGSPTAEVGPAVGCLMPSPPQEPMTPPHVSLAVEDTPVPVLLEVEMASPAPTFADEKPVPASEGGRGSMTDAVVEEVRAAKAHGLMRPQLSFSTSSMSLLDVLPVLGVAGGDDGDSCGREGGGGSPADNEWNVEASSAGGTPVEATREAPAPAPQLLEIPSTAQACDAGASRGTFPLGLSVGMSSTMVLSDDSCSRLIQRVAQGLSVSATSLSLNVSELSPSLSPPSMPASMANIIHGRAALLIQTMTSNAVSPMTCAPDDASMCSPPGQSPRVASDEGGSALEESPTKQGGRRRREAPPMLPAVEHAMTMLKTPTVFERGESFGAVSKTSEETANDATQTSSEGTFEYVSPLTEASLVSPLLKTLGSSDWDVLTPTQLTVSTWSSPWSRTESVFTPSRPPTTRAKHRRAPPDQREVFFGDIHDVSSSLRPFNANRSSAQQQQQQHPRDANAMTSAQRLEGDAWIDGFVDALEAISNPHTAQAVRKRQALRNAGCPKSVYMTYKKLFKHHAPSAGDTGPGARTKSPRAPTGRPKRRFRPGLRVCTDGGAGWSTQA